MEDRAVLVLKADNYLNNFGFRNYAYMVYALTHACSNCKIKIVDVITSCSNAGLYSELKRVSRKGQATCVLIFSKENVAKSHEEYCRFARIVFQMGFKLKELGIVG